MQNLEAFMKNRPHDKNKSIEKATMEYIQQIEAKSIERYQALKEK